MAEGLILSGAAMDLARARRHSGPALVCGLPPSPREPGKRDAADGVGSIGSCLVRRSGCADVSQGER